MLKKAVDWELTFDLSDEGLPFIYQAFLVVALSSEILFTNPLASLLDRHLSGLGYNKGIIREASAT